ncbi:hypothetical protein D3C80_1510140 [compost metagenome]
MKGMKVMVETMALGRMWRNMMAPFCMPSARAARTYSRLRPRRNSARTTSTRLIQENSSMMPSSHQKFGCTKLARMISKYSTGNPDQISRKRCPARSTQPP